MSFGAEPKATPAGAMLRAVEDALRRQGLADLVSGSSLTDHPHATADAAPRHPAPQASSPSRGTNPTPLSVRPSGGGGAAPSGSRSTDRPLKPKQLTAARLLLAGGAVGEVASALRVHRYTVTRWQSDPRFQAELRRQNGAAAVRLQSEAGAAPRNGAPRGATCSRAPARNEATCPGQAGELTLIPGSGSA